jgi:hypothetical protein
MDMGKHLVGVGVALLVSAVVIKVLLLALHRLHDGIRAARAAAPRPQPRECQCCGAPGPPLDTTGRSGPPDGWTCSGCGYELDAAGRELPGQFEGKRKRVLKALAEAEARAAKVRPTSTSEQVRAAWATDTKDDERYKAADGVAPPEAVQATPPAGAQGDDHHLAGDDD